MSSKYEIITNGQFKGRILALRTVRGQGGILEYSGDRGGYVQSASNLSHDGNCWVNGNAVVKENAKVYDNAHIRGSATISDNARVYGNATVSDDAQVRGSAKVYGFADVGDNAIIEQNAEVSGEAFIFGNAIVRGVVTGSASVGYNAIIGPKGVVTSGRHENVVINHDASRDLDKIASELSQIQRDLSKIIR